MAADPAGGVQPGSPGSLGSMEGDAWSTFPSVSLGPRFLPQETLARALSGLGSEPSERLCCRDTTQSRGQGCAASGPLQTRRGDRAAGQVRGECTDSFPGRGLLTHGLLLFKTSQKMTM